MLVPFVTASTADPHPMTMPMPQAPAHHGSTNGWLMIAMHTLGYVVSMTAVAWIVYEKFGVSFIRRAWFNVDLVWAIALIAAGLIALFT
jgi:hypothetical protein